MLQNVSNHYARRRQTLRHLRNGLTQRQLQLYRTCQLVFEMNSNVAFAPLSRFIPMAPLLGSECENIKPSRNLQTHVKTPRLGNLNNPLAIVNQPVVLGIELR